MGVLKMKSLAHRNFWNKTQQKILERGDTIVEVMISMTVLALVVAAAYSIATRSFQTSLNSQYRDQAVSYAQQQLELIKEADNNNPTNITDYISAGAASPGTPFCINPTTKVWQKVDTTNKCIFGSQYTVSIVYDNTAMSFKVTTSWDSATNAQDQSILFYKPNDSFSQGNVANCGPVENDSCASTLTDQPAVGMSSSQPNPVIVNTPVTITWNSTKVAPNSCVAAGPNGFGAANANANPGSFNTSFAAAGLYNFTITCKDNAGNPVLGSLGIVVVLPKPSVTTGSANPISFNSATLNGSVNPNGYATTYLFNYGTTASYGSSTAATSAGAGSANLPVSTAVSGLTQNTPYHFQICATNIYVTTCGNDATFTTATSPPPVINNFYSNQSTTIYTVYGVNRTFTIATSFATSCNINGVAEPTNGTSTVFWAYAYTPYKLTCSGPSGSKNQDIVFGYHQTQVITIDNGFLCGWMFDFAPSSCSETTGLVQVVDGKVAITYAGVCQTFPEGYYGDYGSIPRAYGVYVDYNLGRDCNNY